MLDPFIGDLLLSRVYMETLRPFIEKRNKDGVKTKTINLSLETPTEPTEGMTPISRHRLPKAKLVYWQPWSEWWITTQPWADAEREPY